MGWRAGPVDRRPIAPRPGSADPPVDPKPSSPWPGERPGSSRGQQSALSSLALWLDSWQTMMIGSRPPCQKPLSGAIALRRSAGRSVALRETQTAPVRGPQFGQAARDGIARLAISGVSPWAWPPLTCALRSSVFPRVRPTFRSVGRVYTREGRTLGPGTFGVPRLGSPLASENLREVFARVPAC